MSQPYVGEIRIFGGNFAPAGWMFCHGQVLAISEYDTLFNLIGTTYGGDGQSTFALPDLRGRAPVHMGQGPGLGNYVQGQVGGVEKVTLTANQLPVHSHGMVYGPGTQASPVGGHLAQTPARDFRYATAAGANTFLPTQTLDPAGGSQPHENRSPFLTVNFIISLFGVFPSQT